MKPLPDCLTKLEVTSLGALLPKPKNFYEVIVSRPAHSVRTSINEMLYWSRIPAHRYILNRDALEDHIRAKFLVCILREFDTEN